jgi:hypothetical protein
MPQRAIGTSPHKKERFEEPSSATIKEKIK